MKALLMHRDRDFDTQQELPPQGSALTQDLELDMLFRAMSGEDNFLFDIARRAILLSAQNDVDTILYRQEIMKDCLKHPALVRELYALAVEAVADKRKHYISIFRNYPSGTLYDAIGALQFFTAILKRIKDFAVLHASRFESIGFTTLFAMMQREFSDEYFAEIQDHLKELRFKCGVLVSVELGRGNEGINFVLRRMRDRKLTWLQRSLEWLTGSGPPGYTFRLADRDEAGARILSEMRDRGINLVANALAQSTEHILSFFNMLRTELSFYIAGLNLHDNLAAHDVPISFPQPQALDTRRHNFRALRDVCLVLTKQTNVVGNDLNANGKNLVIITGANQGGKSSFLRAIGLAQLMMQSGMFVTAEFFAAELCAGLFTHYKREEDTTMKSGKLDEELARMNAIVAAIAPDSFVLFNESFASTNEREGSEIARQIVCALVERRIKVFFVTHLYEFAHGMFDQNRQDNTFLRAERLADGTRTFKLSEGEPLETSYGEDLYKTVFTMPSRELAEEQAMRQK
jgi:MutS domain V